MPNEYVRELEQKVIGLTQELSGRVAELQDIRKATFNLWEDLEQEQSGLKDARKATSNLLDDLEKERGVIIAAKAKDEAILASIGDGLVATDKDGKIILVNGAFEKMLGWEESEAKDRDFSEILHMTDESGKEIPVSERLLTKILKGQTTTATTTTTSYKRRDGTFFPVAFTGAPIVVGSELIGAVGVFRDITKEKELDRVKSEFISIASHQLRTPLTGIQWVVERFTKKEELTPKGKEYLNDIHMSAKRLTEMVDLLLNLSRIEAGRVGIAPASFEVIGFVKNFLDEVAPLRDKKELKIIFDDRPAELVITTDKNALRNIVQSLVSNAIEYTPIGGKIEVAIQKKDSTFVMQVRDTGIGIPQAEQSHIFEKFVRASNAKLYKTDGTGIGLYIAERATNLLGGKIWFQSEEGKGSTFSVELPLEFKAPTK